MKPVFDAKVGFCVLCGERGLNITFNHPLSDISSSLSFALFPQVMTKFVRDIRAQNPPVVVILDVGCNCGDLTLSFYDLLLAQLSSSSSSSLSSDSDSSSNSSSSSLPEEGEGKGKEEVGGKRKLERDDDPLPQKIRRCEEGEQRQKVLGDSTSSPQVAILGIDIDPELIERANKTVLFSKEKRKRKKKNRREREKEEERKRREREERRKRGEREFSPLPVIPTPPLPLPI